MVRKHKKKMRKKSSEIAFYGKKTRTKLLMLIYHLRLDCSDIGLDWLYLSFCSPLYMYICSALLTSSINIRNFQAYQKKLIKKERHKSDEYIFRAFWHLYLLIPPHTPHIYEDNWIDHLFTRLKNVI